MPPSRHAAAALEEQCFVGREREMEIFANWLGSASPAPSVLSVSGPGGCGKSTLLWAFARHAREVGRRVVTLDGGAGAFDSASFVETLGVEASAGGGAALDGEWPLVLVDALDQSPEVWRCLIQDCVPKLNTRCKIVVTGRSPIHLDWNRWRSCQHLILPLALLCFTRAESRAYLSRRNVRDKLLVEQLVAATGGNPLALSLAADLVLISDVRDLATAAEWHFHVRFLLEHLLREVVEPGLRAVLDGFAVAQQVDEEALAVLSGETDVASIFDRLCYLSVMRPAEHGLTLQQDVRQLLAQDLAWRQPARYARLRHRALEHFHQRAVTATRSDAEWLLAERLGLSPNPAAAALVFDLDGSGHVSIESARAVDEHSLVQLWSDYQTGGSSSGECVELDATLERDYLIALLHHPATTVRVARARDGHMLGFTTIVRVCLDSLPALTLHPGFAQLVRESWGLAELTELLSKPNAPPIFYMIHLAHSQRLSAAVRAALFRTYLGLFAPAGTYLACTPVAADQAAFTTLGFDPIVRSTFWGAAHPATGFRLDLTDTGIEQWLAAVDRGARPVLREQEADPLGRLTQRERDVVRLLARGRTTNRQLAAELFITPGTANLHVKHILSKLGLGTRAQVAAWAAEAGLSGTRARLRVRPSVDDRGLIPFPALADADAPQTSNADRSASS